MYGVHILDICTTHYRMCEPQASQPKAVANGKVLDGQPKQNQVVKAPQTAARPQTLPDPSVAISLAVTQINAGKLDEAERLLSGIIDESDKRTPNLGAHVARGTARALRRELDGMPGAHTKPDMAYPKHEC